MSARCFRPFRLLDPLVVGWAKQETAALDYRSSSPGDMMCRLAVYIRPQNQASQPMVRNPHSIEGRVAVSRERGIPVSETESAADLMDDSRVGPDGFYTIIVDVEQALGIEASEGNWEFDAGTVNSLVSYYAEILRKRTETQQSNKVKPDSTTD